MLLAFFCNKQSNKRGWNPARGFQPYFFCPVKLLPDSNNIKTVTEKVKIPVIHKPQKTTKELLQSKEFTL